MLKSLFFWISVMCVPLAVKAESKIVCRDLVKHLEAMQRAQSTLLHSMVKRNDAMASTLDLYADDLGSGGRRVLRSDVVSLRKSARTFRKHGVREVSLVDRFEKSSEELIDQVQQCLTDSPVVGTVSQSSELVQR